MHSKLSSLLPLADVDFRRSFSANMLLLEIGTDAENRTSSPLTLATVASDDSIRIGGRFDAQGTARAMRGSRHGTPPSSSWVRLQKHERDSDSLTARPAHFMRRCQSGFCRGLDF